MTQFMRISVPFDLFNYFSVLAPSLLIDKMPTIIHNVVTYVSICFSHRIIVDLLRLTIIALSS